MNNVSHDVLPLNADFKPHPEQSAFDLGLWALRQGKHGCALCFFRKALREHHQLAKHYIDFIKQRLLKERAA